MELLSSEDLKNFLVEHYSSKLQKYYLNNQLECILLALSQNQQKQECRQNAFKFLLQFFQENQNLIQKIIGLQGVFRLTNEIVIVSIPHKYKGEDFFDELGEEFAKDVQDGFYTQQSVFWCFPKPEEFCNLVGNSERNSKSKQYIFSQIQKFFSSLQNCLKLDPLQYFIGISNQNDQISNMKQLKQQFLLQKNINILYYENKKIPIKSISKLNNQDILLVDQNLNLNVKDLYEIYKLGEQQQQSLTKTTIKTNSKYSPLSTKLDKIKSYSHSPFTGKILDDNETQSYKKVKYTRPRYFLKKQNLQKFESPIKKAKEIKNDMHSFQQDDQNQQNNNLQKFTFTLKNNYQESILKKSSELSRFKMQFDDFHKLPDSVMNNEIETVKQKQFISEVSRILNQKRNCNFAQIIKEEKKNSKSPSHLNDSCYEKENTYVQNKYRSENYLLNKYSAGKRYFVYNYQMKNKSNDLQKKYQSLNEIDCKELQQKIEQEQKAKGATMWRKNSRLFEQVLFQSLSAQAIASYKWRSLRVMRNQLRSKSISPSIGGYPLSPKDQKNDPTSYTEKLQKKRKVLLMREFLRHDFNILKDEFILNNQINLKNYLKYLHELHQYNTQIYGISMNRYQEIVKWARIDPVSLYNQEPILDVEHAKQALETIKNMNKVYKKPIPQKKKIQLKQLQDFFPMQAAQIPPPNLYPKFAYFKALQEEKKKEKEQQEETMRKLILKGEKRNLQVPEILPIKVKKDEQTASSLLKIHQQQNDQENITDLQNEKSQHIINSQSPLKKKLLK